MIKSEKYILKVIDDDIIHVLYLEGSVLDVDDMKAVKKGMNELSDSQINQYKILTELQPYVSIINEAKKYGAKNSPDAIASAFVFSGLSQRLLVKFYLKIRSGQKPTKVFTTFQGARKWLINYDQLD